MRRKNILRILRKHLVNNQQLWASCSKGKHNCNAFHSIQTLLQCPQRILLVFTIPNLHSFLSTWKNTSLKALTDGQGHETGFDQWTMSRNKYHFSAEAVYSHARLHGAHTFSALIRSKPPGSQVNSYSGVSPDPQKTLYEWEINFTC